MELSDIPQAIPQEGTVTSFLEILSQECDLHCHTEEWGIVPTQCQPHSLSSDKLGGVITVEIWELVKLPPVRDKDTVSQPWSLPARWHSDSESQMQAASVQMVSSRYDQMDSSMLTW